MSKAGVDALSHALAVEESPHGVRSNILASGGINNAEGTHFLLLFSPLARDLLHLVGWESPSSPEVSIRYWPTCILVSQITLARPGNTQDIVICKFSRVSPS